MEEKKTSFESFIERRIIEEFRGTKIPNVNVSCTITESYSDNESSIWWYKGVYINIVITYKGFQYEDCIWADDVLFGSKHLEIKDIITKFYEALQENLLDQFIKKD
jgi:hypothetical protein